MDNNLLSVVPRRRNTYAQLNAIPMEIKVRRLDTLFDSENVFVHLLSQKKYAYWLDSSRVETGLARFSFMGSLGPLGQVVQYSASTGNTTILKGNTSFSLHVSIFDYLDYQLASMACVLPDVPFDFNAGYIGYFGYELKSECGSRQIHRSRYDDATFIFSDRIIAFDHQEKNTYLVHASLRNSGTTATDWFDMVERELSQFSLLPSVTKELGCSQGPVTFRLHRSHGTYIEDVQSCKRSLRNGDTYEVCLTNRISTDANADPLSVYRTLRRTNRAPYSAYLRLGEVFILSSSPERFLRIGQDRSVEAKPIKGTVARGANACEDNLRREFLRTSEKNRAENLMIVDLLRNDLGSVCEIGSVTVPKLMDVESYETVHQLVSTIHGRLRQDMRAIDCIRAAFPGGSMTGAPKLRTMEIIDDLEKEPRGIYSGAIGFLALNGSVDLSIVIRTIVMTSDVSTIGVGGAIVMQSDAEEEFDEMLLKAHALLRAIGLVCRGNFTFEDYQLIGDRGG